MAASAAVAQSDPGRQWYPVNCEKTHQTLLRKLPCIAESLTDDLFYFSRPLGLSPKLDAIRAVEVAKVASPQEAPRVRSNLRGNSGATSAVDQLVAAAYDGRLRQRELAALPCVTARKPKPLVT